MTRPRYITIGWTRSNMQEGYSSFSDGFKVGASQHSETLEINTDLDASEIAEAAFRATNAPEGLVAPESVAGHIATVLAKRGFDGSQSGHYSLSMGDTVTVDDQVLECASLGWKVVKGVVTLQLKIENHYAGGKVRTKATCIVPLPPEDRDSDEYQDWENEFIFAETGTGQTEGDSAYFVEVTASSQPDVIAVGTEYEFGL